MSRPAKDLDEQQLSKARIVVVVVHPFSDRLTMQGKPQKRQAQKMDEWMDEAACKAHTHTLENKEMVFAANTSNRSMSEIRQL